MRRNRFGVRTKNSGNRPRVVLLANEAPPRRATRAHHSPNTQEGHSMAFARSTIRNCQLLIATTLALGMLTTVSQAYTQEQQQMCTGDAMRLCGAEIPDVDRVTA